MTSMTEPLSDDGLLARVDDVLPLLAENAQRTEREQRVAPENIAALAAAGVYRMTRSRHYGGYESNALTQYDVLRAISSACPATGWVTTIYTAMAWNTGMFADQAQDEVFAEQDVRISSVFVPGGKGERVDGGVVVTGRWPFNTGCHHAQWGIFTALVDGEPYGMLIPQGDLEILDDWNATGLGGTGSNTVVGNGVFVPEHRMLSVADQTALKLASERNRDHPYYNVPVSAFLIAGITAPPVGMARGAYEAFLRRLPGRRITYTDYADQSRAPVTHLQVGEAAMLIEEADAHARSAFELVEIGTDGEFTMEQRARLRLHAASAASRAREAVDVLFQASGATAIQSDVPIQRFQRDVQAAANHAMLTHATSLELYGRVACGLEPNTTFL
jgi:alkylation response protein AidB-like acyl-CoA dehydrogenase